MARTIELPTIKFASMSELKNPELPKKGAVDGYIYPYDALNPEQELFQKIADYSTEMTYLKQWAQRVFDGVAPDPSLIDRANAEVLDIVKRGETHKIADFAVGYIRTRLLLESIWDRILAPIPTSQGDPGVNVETDRDIYYVTVSRQHYDKEMKIEGYTLVPDNDAANIRVWTSPRARMYFYEFTSDEFTFTQKKLEIYQKLNIPIIEEVTRHLREGLVKKKDAFFWKYVTEAINSNPDASMVHAGTTSDLVKADFAMILKYFATKKIPMGFWVIHEAKIQDILSWNHEDLGQMVGQIFINGVRFPAIAGYPLVITHNDELVPPNKLYGFAAPAYLGEQRMIKDFKVMTETKYDTMNMKAKMEAGSIIMNKYGIAVVNFS